MSKTETPCVSVFDLSRKWRKYPMYALERVFIQWSRLLLEFEWVYLEKWTCRQRPFTYTAKAENATFLLWGTITQRHVKSGISMAFLILTWVWVTAWCNCVIQGLRIVASQSGKHGILPSFVYLESIPVSKTETPCVSVFDLNRKWKKDMPCMHWREYAFNGVAFWFYFLQERSWIWVWMGMSWEMNMLTKAFHTYSKSRKCHISALRYHHLKTCQKWNIYGVSYFDLSLSRTAWWNCVMEVWWL